MSMARIPIAIEDPLARRPWTPVELPEAFDVPAARPLEATIVVARRGAPRRSGRASTIAFFGAIVVAVAGASAAGLHYGAPDIWDPPARRARVLPARPPTASAAVLAATARATTAVPPPPPADPPPPPTHARVGARGKQRPGGR
jgi:hypothetical protein